MYDEQKDSINEEFFKKCVCSVILFDTLDSKIGKASWYPKGGNKAQITPYTIAKFFSVLPHDKDIDWQTIWNKQTLYPELVEELLRIAYITHNYLNEAAGGGIVRTISRTLGVWTKFKDEVKYELTDDFYATLVSKEETKTIEAAAKRAHKFNSNIDNAVEIFKLGANYWAKVYADLLKENILTYGDVEFIRSISGYIGKGSLPSTSQCKRLAKIVTKAEDKGYIMP